MRVKTDVFDGVAWLRDEPGVKDMCILEAPEEEGIASGNMGELIDEDMIIGTGCYYENHITGVYVLPNHQNKGCGTIIIDHLEAEIAKNHDTVALDASLAAVFLYEHRGYKTVGHGKYDLENGIRLVYEVMEKKI